MPPITAAGSSLFAKRLKLRARIWRLSRAPRRCVTKQAFRSDVFGANSASGCRGRGKRVIMHLMSGFGRAALAFLLISGFWGSAAEAERRLALIVGNGAYETIGSLRNPPADAQTMKAALQAAEFETTLLLDADQLEMKRAITAFGRRLRSSGPDSVGLFFYAGHGVQSRGRNFLIPVDTGLSDEADLDVYGVEAQWVLRQMESAGNVTNIVILDACRDNPFGATMRSASRGLAPIDAPTGSFIAYATAPGAVAADGRADNSPYTAALAKRISTPNTPIEQVFKRVRVDVINATSGRQTPWDSSSLVNDFYFYGDRTNAPAAAATAPADGGDVEQALWNQVLLSRDLRKLDAFLEIYPEGRFKQKAESLRLLLAPPVGVGAATKPDTAEVELAAVDPIIEPPSAVESAEATEKALGLTRDRSREIQRRLTLIGFDTNGVDGIFGPASRSAITSWQESVGSPATGFLTSDQIDRLNAQSETAYAAYVADRQRRAQEAERRRAAASSQASQPDPIAPTASPAAPARKTEPAPAGRFIDLHGCLRERNGDIVPGYRTGC